MDTFYRELARRVVATANAHQHERAAQLLCIALDAVDWQVEEPPEALQEAWGDLSFYLNTKDLTNFDGYDPHELFESGIKYLETYLAETPA